MAALGDTQGKITDDGIAKMRERIGVVVPQESPFNLEATLDTIRHFASAYGDDNPLYTDPEYGKRTRWSGLIAPPVFLTTTGVSEVREIRPEIRKRGEHALAGVHEFFSGDEWEWFLPVRPGDRFTRRYYLYDVVEKERSAFTGGRSVITKYRADYVNQHGELVAVDRYLFVRAERDAAVKKGKYSDIQRASYTPDEIAKIEAAYAKEFRRGAKPLHWEDVREGEDLPTMVKGPFTLTDAIAWVRGWGGGPRHSRIAWKHRQRHPKFYTPDEHGVPDVVERVHWDDAWARKIGNPTSYDYGRMRTCYLQELVTNWMGDEAWLWKLSTEFRQFNYLGDTTWVKGRVKAKRVTPEGHHVADLEVWCEDQRARITAPGTASVILPSKAKGAVTLPKPGKGTEGTVELVY